MRGLCFFLQLIVSVAVIQYSNGISSPLLPFTTYKHSTELEANTADLWWTVDADERGITFELHIKTKGWIALGISPAGGMEGADIGMGWIDHTGNMHFQDRYATSNTRPVIDNTTTDWFALRGLEENGWTAIQFTRLLDTCDSMDVPIKSGTNVLIFAYGVVDPDPSRPDGDITYHQNRRGSRIIPLRSYADPPSDDKFAELDFFEFRLNNYVVPATDTTYHCKLYKASNRFPTKRHAIAHKTLIDSANRDIVHHLLMYECDPTAVFDDSKLPEGVCDDIYSELTLCSSNIATGWAIGGDDMHEFTQEAGYPVGGDFLIQYYLVQMHYDNPHSTANRVDSSGIRFYLGNELRQHDLGYLTLGTNSNGLALAIPPKADQFIVDSYCSAKATLNFPKSGITVVSAFPHTHLQGRSVWTKLIRNHSVEQYLFNGESYSFNYQFQNLLPEPIKLYPGDEFATRCVYNTMNKSVITLGGERTRDEMCLHMFTYYPRMDDLYGCQTMNSDEAWLKMMNSSASKLNRDELTKWVLDLKWTPELAVEWQKFYNDASRRLKYGRAAHFEYEHMPHLPEFNDLKPAECKKQQNETIITSTNGSPIGQFNSAIRQEILFPFSFTLILMRAMVAFFE